MDAIERLKSKITVDAATGCWVWVRADNSQGYGRFYFAGRKHLAHRAAYILLKGPIPNGLSIDHLCRNPLCVNPDHLEPVTHRENVVRGLGPKVASTSPNLKIGAELQRQKKHCPKGHPYDVENLFIRSDGRRECRTCRNASSRAQNRKRKTVR